MKVSAKKITALCLALFLCLPVLLCGCSGGGNDTGVDTPSGMQLASPAGVGYYLFVPQGWLVEDRGAITVASMSAYSSVSVTMVDFTSEKSPAEYWETSHAENEQKFTDIVMKEEGKDTVMDGSAALRYAFSGVYHDGNTYAFLQCITKKDGRLYVLTYTASEAEYETNLPAANSIIEAFAFAEKQDVPQDKTEITDGAPEGMKQISDDGIHPFRFYVPISWKTDMQSGFLSAYVSEDDRSNVSFVSSNPPPGVQDVSAFFASMQEERENLLSNYRLLSPEGKEPMEVEVAGGRGYGYVYEGENGGVTYRVYQVIFVSGAYFYTFTYTATADLYDTHMPEVESILASLIHQKQADK